ncbi:MAG TPA: MFS transporter [Gaiellaceae bacterium]|nr:MFS transporter [Gaiellaceae bacterium]
MAASVAVAFADSSIVVLALPDLYGAFDTTIVGVSLVITSYNLVVAVVAAVVAFTRVDARRAAQIGLVLFAGASAGCAAAWSLAALIAFRCVQGLGAALLLASSLALLGGLRGSRARGAALWTTVAVLGAALGPVLGGVLTQLFDWRAIFVVQAPVAAVALLATRGTHALPDEAPRRRRRGALAADAALGLVFAALVGALFLAVLLVITVWGLEPITGALVVSALPAATLAARPLGRGLSMPLAVGGGSLLLAAGLAALALLPRVSNALVALALAFCGTGIGLAVPVLTRASLDLEIASGTGPAGPFPSPCRGQGPVPEAVSLVRSGAITVAARHAGLVLALVLVAPLLTGSLDDAGRRALLGGTKEILDANVPIRKKVPIALALRDALEQAPRGEVPDLGKPFDDAGARSDSHVREARDDLVTTLESALTRGFRPAFGLAALFALLSIVPAARLRRAA